MNKEFTFAVWAPAKSPWSSWAKPVLFAHLDAIDLAPTGTDVSQPSAWAPAANGKTAIVLDLPGESGVHVGLALAQNGFRPVPLYNAIPAPRVSELMHPDAHRRWVAVDVRPIIRTICRGTELLAKLDLATNAPPVFLLDYDRSGFSRVIGPDSFDNRSICFTTDFPSALFLSTHGIERVRLVQQFGTVPHTDLSHTLRRWQEGGLTLERMSLDAPGLVEPLNIPRPSWFGMMFQRTLASLGMHRAPGGGFGNWIPEAHGGGGG